MITLQNENKNTAKNFNSVSIGKLKLYFSYETCIAYENDGRMVASENVRSNTTGEHL